MTTRPQSDVSNLEERVQKLAADKSNLQLIVRMMNRINAVAGLDNVVEGLLQTISDVIGGVNLGLYYVVDQHLHYADAFGTKKSLTAADDELVRQVFQTRQTVEIEHPFSATEMLTPEFTKGYTWVVPLVVGPDLVGVLKLERLHLAMRDLSDQLPTFFSYAALVLKNEISGHSRLQQAFARLEREMAERQHAEEALRQINETLEERVAERTDELRRSNAQARRLNRELQAISSCNQVLMRAEDEPALLNAICRIVCDEAGYRMAWVGYAENDAPQTVRIVAQAGIDDGYLAAANITWADTEYGRGPTGSAIRSGRSACSTDIATDPSVAPWREQALRRGYRSSLALPLKDESARTFGALTIYSTEPNAFPPEEVRLMEELAGDLAFGISILRDRIERKQAGEALRDSEAKYRSLIQKLQTAVVVHAADTRILTCNPIAQSLLGLTEDQLLGKTAIDPAWHFFREDGTRMPPEEYPIAQALATRQPIRNLVLGVHRPASGPDVWAMVNANPVFGPDGQITETIVTFIDVTERMLAQERLAHLAAIVESSDDAIIGKALDETIVSWNRGAERIYGYTAAEIVGCPITILVPPGSKEELATIMDGVKRGAGVEHLETTRVRKDGQTIHVVLTISPIRDTRGQIVGASTIARDNTERKRAEQALRESQALYHSLVEQLSVGFFRKNAAGRYVYVNPLFCRLKGLNAESFLDRTPAEVKDIELAANGPNVVQVEQLAAQAEDHHRQIMATGRSIVIEELGFGPGGEKQYFSVLKTPVFDSAGKITGSQGIMFDITELKRIEEQVRRLNAELEQRVADRTRELAASEERMRLFFERQLMGAAISSPEKGWLQVNDKLCQMLGYPREKLLQMTWAELTYPEDLAADVAQFERLLRGEIEGYMIEKRFLRKDGSLVFTNLAVGCVRRPDRSVDYLLALMEDITERKRAEASIQQLNKELRQRAASLEIANKELESFSYSVSHDLRAPLRSIDGFSRVLLDDCADKLTADEKDSLGRIRAASQRMGHLIDDLLNLARVARDEMRRGPVALSALANTVAARLQQATPDQTMEFVIAPGLVAEGDARLLQIVLENLFGNACKFSSHQPVARIEFGQTTHKGAPAYFVRDNGAGFDRAAAHKLFGAFQRFHATEEFPGTGIGLATVQRIIRRHGGHVAAESRPGHGATFYFTLPEQPKEH